MPLINSLLVKWAGGFSEVTNATSIAAHGRYEALLGLGAIGSRAEMVRVAQQQLAIYGDPRVEITADVAPADEADTPYLAYGVGDTVVVPGMDGTPGRERVLALTVAEDQDGRLTYAPDLRNVLLSQNERIEQAIKKMSDGTLRGDSKVATPTSQVSANTRENCCVPTPPSGWTATFVDLTGSYTETASYTLDASDHTPASFRLIAAFPPGTNPPGSRVTVWFNAADPAVGYTFDMWSGLEGDVDITGGIFEALDGNLAPGDQITVSVEPEPYDATWSVQVILTFPGGHTDVTVPLGGDES